MVIVSGKLYVDSATRSRYLDACRVVIEQARRARGCVDFHLSADPLEEDRINVYEQWESVADVEAFRGSGPDADQTAAIVAAHVVQYEVTASVNLSGDASED